MTAILFSFARVAASLAVLTAACQPVLATAGDLPTGHAAGDMELSPFYRWSGPLPDRAGTLLRQEPMREQADITAAAEASRILYVSTDARWNSGAIPVSGVLYLPKGEPPAGGWPLMAWGHGTVGIADVCAPSWTGLRARDATYLNRWLEAGFAVVAPDYQGLGGPGPHPYHNWRVEGRSVLDAARAAIADHPGVIANAVVVGGQSQGSGAALGAGRLAQTYAPDLNVVGVVATGLTSTFPEGPVPVPVRDSANVFLSFASGGLKDDGPAIDDIVSPAGREVLEVARTACTREIGLKARELRIGSLAESLSITLEALAKDRLPTTDMPMEAVGTPVMIGTGLSDATIIPMRQYAAAAAICAVGTPVLWRAYSGLGHDGALHGSFEDSLAFARSRLKGETPPSNCADIAPPGAPGSLNPDAPFNDD